MSTLEDYDVLVDQVPTWERRLSSLLGNIKIKFDQESPSASVTEYLNYLYRVVSSLKRGMLGPDASTSIQPGEFEGFTTRILRYIVGININNSVNEQAVQDGLENTWKLCHRMGPTCLSPHPSFAGLWKMCDVLVFGKELF